MFRKVPRPDPALKQPIHLLDRPSLRLRYPPPCPHPAHGRASRKHEPDLPPQPRPAFADRIHERGDQKGHHDTEDGLRGGGEGDGLGEE